MAQAQKAVGALRAVIRTLFAAPSIEATRPGGTNGSGCESARSPREVFLCHTRQNPDKSAKLAESGVSEAQHSEGELLGLIGRQALDGVITVGAAAAADGLGSLAVRGATSVGGRLLAPAVRGTGGFLRGTEGNAGLVPQGVADALRRQTFRSPSEFRSTFWTEVSKDPKLMKSFSRSNQTLIERGNAPFVARTQQFGGRRRYELHHRVPVGRGGDPYDPDNIIVVTPRYHRDV
ncbi:HNH endonuclease signature motif containing protein [Patulibacter sp. NPDC049589]|uniref:HNH endonuclease signature motif containing protein n=1 Tax=Patulibacter sp. NPDC049589 TaxID=3154731 RepID=UPI00341C667C